MHSGNARQLSLAIALSALVMGGCDSTTGVRPLVPDAALAKGAGTGPTVTSTDPSYGHRSDQNIVVQVYGSGFTTTSVVAWERNGVADPKLHVNSVTYVSSGQLTANLTIASDADLASYDVSVMSGTKKGVGQELFAVTTAYLIPGSGAPGNADQAWDINDAGQVVGRLGTGGVWTPSVGVDVLTASLPFTEPFAINEAGTIVVGNSTKSAGYQPVVWVGSAGSWTATAPTSACITSGTAVGGGVRAVSRDGHYAGGNIEVNTTRTSGRRPVRWDLVAGTCSTLPLAPAPYNTWGNVRGVNDLGMSVGMSLGSKDARAVFWSASGTPTVLAPVPGDAGSTAYAIDNSGTIVVGVSDSHPVYWYFNGTSWSGAIVLANSGRANAVNDYGLIGGLDGGNGYAVTWQVTAGVAGPEVKVLKNAEILGLNNNTASGQAWAAGGGLGGAVYWIRP